MESPKQSKVRSAPMLGLVISMSMPAMFSMLIQALYNIVDSMFVAKLGEQALTSVSLVFPVQTLIISMAVGTGIGLNSLISRKLGEKNYEDANVAASHGIFLSLTTWLIFAIIGALFSKSFISFFTTDADVVKMGSEYMSIIMIFSFANFVQIAFEKILQATGNMVYPMYFQLTGAIVNIILDPILIFGLLGFPALGVAGAAIATVIGQVSAMAFCLIIVFKKNHDITIKVKGFRPQLKVIKDIYVVGLPSIIMQSIGSLLVVGLNTILIGFSQSAVAVLGIYYKLQSFIFMPVFGLNQGLMPIMGFNFGAGNKRRLIESIKIGVVIAVSIMVLGTIGFMTLPKLMLSLFESTPDMIEIGVPALRIVSIGFVFAAINIIFSTLFQAVGNGVSSMYISVLRQLVIILPVSYVFAKAFGLHMVWYAFPLAEIVAMFISIFLFVKLYKDKIQYLKIVD